MSQGKPRKEYLERMAKIENKQLFELVDSKEKEWIEKTLTDLYMVNWDRYFIFEGFSLTAFGWIEREDNYKDFVILEFTLKDHKNPPCVYFLGTSSKKYSKTIAEILGSDHADCKRIENYFDIENCIKLRDSEEKQNLAEFLSCRLEYSPELIGDLIKEFRGKQNAK